MTVSNMKTRKKHNTKTTKILLCISTAFLILNGPIATSKIYYLLKHDFFGSLTSSQSSSDSSPIKKSHFDRLSSIVHSTSSDYYDDDHRLFNITSIFNLSHHLPYLDRNNDSIDLNEQTHHINLSFSSSSSLTNGRMGGQTNTMEKLAGMLTSNLYYLNFVLNFFLYSLNGSKFRRLFFGLFRRNFMRRAYLSTRPRRFKNMTMEP